jgi:hypothetical protein
MKIFPDRLSPGQDEFYNALMDAHAGLSESGSQALNARLVLLMANQIGDIAMLRELLETARAYADG